MRGQIKEIGGQGNRRLIRRSKLEEDGNPLNVTNMHKVDTAKHGHQVIITINNDYDVYMPGRLGHSLIVEDLIEILDEEAEEGNVLVMFRKWGLFFLKICNPDDETFVIIS